MQDEEKNEAAAEQPASADGVAATGEPPRNPNM